MTNRELFGKFAIAFVVVALAGFATYILYPAVPPWMAAEPLVRVHGTYVWTTGGHVYLPGVQNLQAPILGRWFNSYHGTIFFPFLHLHYDNVGAIPSEHAAYPLLFFLFLRRQFGRPAYLAFIYIAGILFSITYLGQHYVIDAVIGFAYAVVGYGLVMHVAPMVRRRLRKSERPATRPVLVPARELVDIEEA
jgi:membrane-associated phospholipid phosphatase